MTASLRVEDFDVITHETVNDLERPWNSDYAHEGLNLGWFQLQHIFVEGKQTQIKELFESLRKVTDHQNDQKRLVKTFANGCQSSILFIFCKDLGFRENNFLLLMTVFANLLEVFRLVALLQKLLALLIRVVLAHFIDHGLFKIGGRCRFLILTHLSFKFYPNF